ncbi:MAG: hypothetical protein WCT08_06475 [Patescibacteria group bacterium]
MHRKFHQIDSRERIGRFTNIPSFQEEEERRYWQEFSSSFLKGENREKRLREIIDLTNEELPALISRHNIPEDEAQLIALSGSSFYGPRKKDSRLTDVDIHFLMNEEVGNRNFEIFPNLEDNELALKYHLMWTGKTDSARGERNEIHWLLYPHYPLINKLSGDELKELMSQLSHDTLARKDEIAERIGELKRELEKESQSQTFDKYD